MSLFFRRCAAALTVSAALLPATGWPAGTVTTLVEDSFSYPGGVTLTGQNGGTGWTSAWMSDSPSFTDFRTNATGLTYPGLATAGGRAQFVAAGTQINDAARTLPLVNSGVVFVQFLAQFGVQSGGGTPNIRLSAGGAGTGWFGGNGNCTGTVFSILDGNGAVQAGGASCSTVPLSTLSLVVVQIDYANANTRMWLNPDLATFDYLAPPAANATFTGLAPAFDRIALYSRTPGNIDELRVFRVAAAPVAATPVPGLSWAGVAALSAMLAAAGVWARTTRRFSRRQSSQEVDR